MTPEFLTTIFAGVTLLLYFTVSTIGAVVSIFKKIDKVRDEILFDVNAKHNENRVRVDALNALVIRHDTMLNPEFNGNFGAHRAK